MTAARTSPRPPQPAPRRPGRARAPRRLRRRLVRSSLLWLLAAGLVAGGSFAAGLLSAPINFATPEPPRSALLLDDHGHLFATIRSPEVHQEVPASAIPPVMRDAIVAAEDQRFYQHSGVDPLALLRAAWRDLTGSTTQGGSTITQQYVKNVYTGSERTALRKLREAALAIRLEQRLSKSEILTRYLNTLYLGNGAYGVQAASEFYFGVPVARLDYDPRTHVHSAALALARASMLAGMGPAPSLWNPVHSPAAARSRQLYTLNRMVAAGMITAQQASDAYGDRLPAIVGRSQPDLPTVAPEFRDLVAQQLQARYGPDVLFRGGLRITTTLDLNLQKAAVAALHQVLPAAADPEAAVVAVDPQTGDVRALTEKRDGGYRKDGLDLATDAVRSSGSTIKPFTLAVALEEGHSPDEGVYGPPLADVPNPGGTPDPYPIHNAGDSESGYFTLRSALEQSVNTVYGPLALRVGLRRVLDLALAAGMRPVSSFTSDIVPAKSLGVPVTPLSEAVAYGTLVDHGVHHAPRELLRVTGDAGTVYAAARAPAGTRVLPATVADQVTGVMQGVVDRGTGTAARQSFPVFGKTGTTDDYTNAWFTGCTRQVCITVWMGYDKQYLNVTTANSMRNVEGVPQVFGGTLPAEIFSRVWSDYLSLRGGGPASPSPTPTPPPAPVFVPPPATTPPPTRTPAPARTRVRRTPAPVRTSSSPAATSPPPPTLLPTPAAPG